MSASMMGRRYERLLFFAGPLALGCLLVLFVALAIDQQEERRQARCLTVLADRIELHSEELQKAFDRKKALISGKSTDSYWLALSYLVIYTPGHECRKYYLATVPERPSDAIPKPSVLVEQVREKIASLERQPLVIYGVEIPEKATINVLGTPIRMELVAFVKAIQIALGPILLLWLGSMYNTRHRETLHISQMTDVRSLYPHIMNVYPVMVYAFGQRLEPRRRGFAGSTFYLANRFGVPVVTTLTRIALLVVFVGPPIGFYIASVYFVNLTDFSYLSAALGLLVGMFALVNAFAEMISWHANKRFRVVSSVAT